ncbi:MAG: endonuclease domain-containing protein [Ignavibacteriales bacterium]|nr:endonuclease domain-containing protein [Ignavibacteriales bacterium]
MPHKIIRYNPKLKGIARTLRNNSTIGEILLWKRLRNKQMLGYDFHRQKPIDEFVVDFFCPKLMLAIEIDGGSHENDEAHDKDKKRQSRLESLGITFLRFKESDVRSDIRSVVDVIEDWIRRNTK